MAAQTNSPTEWVGWAYFASVMTLVLGALQGVAGLTGIFKNTFYGVSENALLAFNYRTWGWIDLVLGILLILVSLELLRGGAWSRVLGVFLGILTFVASAAFINAFPLWSVIVMIVDVMVIYSLTVRKASE